MGVKSFNLWVFAPIFYLGFKERLVLYTVDWSKGTELLLHCYAEDLQATASINGAVITSLGGVWKVTNKYYKSGIAHIYVERTTGTKIDYNYTLSILNYPTEFSLDSI